MKMFRSALLISCAVACFLSMASAARAQLLTGMRPFPQPPDAITSSPGPGYQAIKLIGSRVAPALREKTR